MRVLGFLLIASCWQERPAVVEPAPTSTGVIVEAPGAATIGPAVRASSRPPSSPYAEVAGTWKGTGFQYDTKGQWDIEMTLFKRGGIGDVIGTIAYENGGCTAELLRQPERGDTLVMREKLVTGQGRCVDDGWIRIPRRPIANELDWRWDFAAGNEGASSTVKRD